MFYDSPKIVRQDMLRGPVPTQNAPKLTMRIASRSIKGLMRVVAGSLRGLPTEKSIAF
jgi:hypothetical protein